MFVAALTRTNTGTSKIRCSSATRRISVISDTQWHPYALHPLNVLLRIANYFLNL